MVVVHSPLHARHDGGMELHRGELVPLFECPARVDYILDAVTRAGFDVVPPADFDDAALAAMHDADYLAFLRSAWDDWVAAGKDGFALPSGFPGRGLRRDRVPRGIDGRLGYYGFDAGTPFVAGTWEAARASAHCAITAAARVAAGERVAYALCRPPGHHAGRASYGGYCYLNNAALAAQRLRDAGHDRVAVLDVDFHHGNGTQDIFYARGDVFTVSIHGTPDSEYPWFLGWEEEHGEGDGEGANLNLPLVAGADWATWSRALDVALDAIARFGATALVVALGVDTFEGDPISAFRLAAADYPRMGERIAGLGLPTVMVQEGGYAVAEIGTNVVGVLRGFAAGG